MTTRRHDLALAALPLAFTAVLFLMRASSLPFWQSFNLDPDYYYLLNGLRIVEYLAPTDVSHPGTPVQAFIAAVLRLMHPGLPPAGIVEAVLDDPERHLVAVTTAMYPLVGLALWWMGRAFLSATGQLAPALLAQSAPLLSMVIPKFAIHPKPEPFLVIAVCLLMVAGLRAARAEPLEDRHAKWLGVALGFGIACKIHFVALGLVPLLLLDRRRLLLILPVATVAAFLVFVSPAIPSQDIWFDWLRRIFLYSGAYGEGTATVIDAGRFPRAVMKLFASKLIFTAVFVASGLALAGYFRLRRRGLIPRERLARLLAGILAAQLFTVLATAKQPAAHYLLPALMLTGPALAILWVLTARVFPASTHARGWAVVGVALAGLTAPAVWRQNAELAGWTRDAQAFDMGRFAACAKIDYDAASTLPYALQRGDMNAAARYSPKLAERMPKDHYTWFTNDHTWWKRGLMQWNQPRVLAEVLSAYPCALFRGSQPWTADAEANRLMPGLRFDDRCVVGEETLMTKGVTCAGEAVRPLAN